MCLEVCCRGIFGEIEHDYLVGYKNFSFREDGIYPFFQNTRYILALRFLFTWSGVVEVSAQVKEQGVRLIICSRGRDGWAHRTSVLVPMGLGIHVSPFEKAASTLQVAVHSGLIPVVFNPEDVMLVGQDIVVKRLFVFPLDSSIQNFVTDITWRWYEERYWRFKAAAEREV